MTCAGALGWDGQKVGSFVRFGRRRPVVGFEREGLNSFVQKCDSCSLGWVRLCAGGNRLCKNAAWPGAARVRACVRRED